MILAGKKHTYTWHIGLLCQGFWFFWIFNVGEWGLLPLTIIITIIYVKNLFGWNNELLQKLQ
jgi:hypothetical protein